MWLAMVASNAKDRNDLGLGMGIRFPSSTTRRALPSACQTQFVSNLRFSDRRIDHFREILIVQLTERAFTAMHRENMRKLHIQKDMFYLSEACKDVTS